MTAPAAPARITEPLPTPEEMAELVAGLWMENAETSERLSRTYRHARQLHYSVPTIKAKAREIFNHWRQQHQQHQQHQQPHSHSSNSHSSSHSSRHSSSRHSSNT